MARPSKLTDKQWSDIERRHLKGEKMRALAKEYGISEGAIRARVSTQNFEIKQVVNQVVEAEQRFNALPVSAQVSARSLIDELKAISFHLASAGKYGAMTSHRLSGIANAQVEKIDDDEPLGPESLETLKGISALTRLANDSSMIAVNLLNANKDAMKSMDSQESNSTQLLKDIAAYLPD